MLMAILSQASLRNYEEGAETRRLPPKQLFLYGEEIVQTTNIFNLAVKTVVCKLSRRSEVRILCGIPSFPILNSLHYVLKTEVKNLH